MQRRGVALVLLALVSCGRTQIFEGVQRPVAQISPPTAHAFTSQPVTLDGLSSVDPEGESLDFHWRIRSRPPGSSAELDSLSLSETHLRPDQPGTWLVELIVSAGSRTSLPFTARLTVEAGDGQLVANAGPDQVARPGDQIPLDGSASFDPLGLPLSFLWQLLNQPSGSPALVTNETSARPGLKVDLYGAYELRLKVTAGTRIATDTVRITVPRPNSPPIAVAGPLRSGVVGISAGLDGRASSDPDGDPLTFAWAATTKPVGSSAALSTLPTGLAWFTPDVPGVYAFLLTVSDGRGGTSSDGTSVTVEPRPDAGVDAGVDAGMRVDAGFDAGVPLDGGDLFDPSEVYLAGTLSEGACYLDAFAHWSTPNTASLGFDCYFDERAAIIRPTDGRLLYTNTFEDLVREFHCDTCPYTGGGNYPPLTKVNDPILPTTCVAPDHVEQFRVAPDGALFHSCNQSGLLWRDASGRVVYDGTTDAPVAFGPSGWLLTQHRVLNLQTMASFPLTGMPFFSWSASRWNGPDGFFVATGANLWRVSTSGVVQLLGTYPPLPPPIVERSVARLDGAGRLFLMAYIASSSTDVIVRRQVGGTADIVYTEASNPLVKIHVSSLVTGP